MEEEDFSETSFVILPLVQPDIDDFVDIDRIRELNQNGLDNPQPEDRCISWLVLMHIYPEHASLWNQKRNDMVELYHTYIEQFGLREWTSVDLPLHPSEESFTVQNKALMNLIHGDIIRTGRHIFMLPPAPIGEFENGEESILLYAVHLRRLERILYVMGSINPTMSYMQGFNELVMPLYYTIYLSQSLFTSVFEVEAITFHCLHQLLSSTQVIDLFTTQDKSSILLHRLNPFHEILKMHVPSCYHKIMDLDIHPLVYAYRWFLLIFSQEYEMPSLQQIWDALFTHFDQLLEFEFYIGAAQIKLVEDMVLSSSYTETVSILQNIRVRNVYELLQVANKWWNNDHSTSSGFLSSTLSSTLKFLKSFLP